MSAAACAIPCAAEAGFREMPTCPTLRSRRSAGIEADTMDTNKLKKMYEKMPEPVKDVLAIPIHRGLVGNKIFISQTRELEASESMSGDQLAELQLSKLRDLCEYCYAASPFYKRRFDEAGVCPETVTFEKFATLPLLDKEQVLASYDEISVPIPGEGSYAAETGGSSGRRLVVMNSDECFYRENAFAMHFYGTLGYDFRRSKLAYFGGDGSTLVTTSPLYRMVRCNTKLLNEGNLEEAVRRIDAFAPDYLRGLTSSVSFFAQLLSQTGMRLRKRPKGVFLQSENIHPYQLRQFEEAFGCPVRISYGSTERTVFGEQVAWDGDTPVYKFNRLYGLTEIVDGHIVGTGFINRRMPLLRYEIDDAVEPRAGGYAIKGHRNVPVVGRNGEHISTASLCDLGESASRLLSFQFVQDEPGRLRMDYITASELDDAEKDALLRSLGSKFMGNMECELRRVDVLQLTPRGKRTLLIQRLNVEQ